MTEEEFTELLDDIEAAGSNQSGALEWGTGGFDRATRQGRDLKAQALAVYRAQAAQLARMREALEAIVKWDDAGGWIDPDPAFNLAHAALAAMDAPQPEMPDPEVCPKCGSDIGHRINCPDGIAFTRNQP